MSYRRQPGRRFFIAGDSACSGDSRRIARGAQPDRRYGHVGSPRVARLGGCTNSLSDQTHRKCCSMPCRGSRRRAFQRLPFDVPFDSQSSSVFQYSVEVQPAPLNGLLAIRVLVESLDLDGGMPANTLRPDPLDDRSDAGVGGGRGGGTGDARGESGCGGRWLMIGASFPLRVSDAVDQLGFTLLEVDPDAVDVGRADGFGRRGDSVLRSRHERSRYGHSPNPTRCRGHANDRR